MLGDMSDMKNYFATSGQEIVPPTAEFDALVARYPWFAPARTARQKITGVTDPQLTIVAPWRSQSALCREEPDRSAFTDFSSEDIIVRFLLEDDLRIVAEEGEAEGEVLTEAHLDDDDEVVSEELAEIYLVQGLRDRAVAIYRKLSLRNPEKSVYFAELISKIEN